MVLCLGEILGRGCLCTAVGIITLPCFLEPGSSSAGAHTAPRCNSCLRGPAWPSVVYLKSYLKIPQSLADFWNSGVGWEAWPPIEPCPSLSIPSVSISLFIGSEDTAGYGETPIVADWEQTVLNLSLWVFFPLEMGNLGESHALYEPPCLCL